MELQFDANGKLVSRDPNSGWKLIYFDSVRHPLCSSCAEKARAYPTHLQPCIAEKVFDEGPHICFYCDTFTSADDS